MNRKQCVQCSQDHMYELETWCPCCGTLQYADMPVYIIGGIYEFTPTRVILSDGKMVKPYPEMIFVKGKLDDYPLPDGSLYWLGREFKKYEVGGVLVQRLAHSEGGCELDVD